MIPKIIHYSWISNEPMPETLQLCMESWHRVMPEYQLMLWDADRIAQEVDCVFVDEALSARKWAFAADYVRLYAVYKYGGVWLDTDVQVLKPFDYLMDERMFIGKEKLALYHYGEKTGWVNNLTSHCFGAEMGHPFLLRCLSHYEGRHFVLSSCETLPLSLRYDMRLLPEIQATLAQEYGYEGNPLYDDKEELLNEDIKVLPFYVFDSPHYHNMDDVFCIHHQAGGWFAGKDGKQMSLSRLRQRKGMSYYMLTFVNWLLKRKHLRIQVQSL